MREAQLLERHQSHLAFGCCRADTATFHLFSLSPLLAKAGQEHEPPITGGGGTQLAAASSSCALRARAKAALCEGARRDE